MIIAAEFPEAQEVRLYDLIGGPVARLGRWTVRRRRGVSDAELHATAYGMIADFEEMLALPRIEFRTRVLAEGEEPTDESEEVAGLNALLLSVRRCRGDILGSGGEALARAIQVREPELSTRYLRTRAQVLEFLEEFERMLVLLGAGTEEDAELGMPLVPVPPEMPPGPTVYLDL